ncbi:HAD family hydrolase [Bacillus alkalicellulosilyticus]|uniref:HAD family hydrolase n=1 Tax=Alkalihalobacterium alkalicellulosilyticum TaxID=1912214 RepID=UPI000998AEA2|nr:HAD-IA family hydrolase [Bacillus alkalicellulosilyticus]
MLQSFSAIMFDMDNTLLRSSIDFKKMKKECMSVLIKNNIKINEDNATTSQLLEFAKQLKREENRDVILAEMYSRVENCEKEGMISAKLEPHCEQVIKELAKSHLIVVVTNNTTSAAQQALKETNIVQYFDHIFGRDDLEAMKPSPLAIQSVLKQYSYTPDQWVMVGDSWIDGMSAQKASVRYIAYCANEIELQKRQVCPLHTITSLTTLVKG